MEFKRKVGKGDVVTLTYRRAADNKKVKETFLIGDKLDFDRKPFPMYDVAHPWAAAVLNKYEGAEVSLPMPEENVAQAVIARISEAYIPEPAPVE